jgi:hypothetical protein
MRSQSNYVGLSQSKDKMIVATQFKLSYKRNAFLRSILNTKHQLSQTAVDK